MADDNMEYFTLPSGQRLLVHAKKVCEGPCALHSPSDHHMKNWNLTWHADGGLERVCSHGIGHPDPDSLRNLYKHRHSDKVTYASTHSCDGCCKPPEPEWSPAS